MRYLEWYSHGSTFGAGVVHNLARILWRTRLGITQARRRAICMIKTCSYTSHVEAEHDIMPIEVRR